MLSLQARGSRDLSRIGGLNRMITPRNTTARDGRHKAGVGRAGAKRRSAGTIYRLLVENLDAALFEVDSGGYVTYVSKGVKGLLGHEPRLLIGHHFAPYIHPDDLERAQSAFAATLADRPQPRDFRMLTKRGEPVWVRATTRRVRSPGGRTAGVRGILTDISAHKRLEEDLRATAERFRKAFHSSPCLMSLS
jgi:PAS domain S-box-containing protein